MFADIHKIGPVPIVTRMLYILTTVYCALFMTVTKEDRFCFHFIATPVFRIFRHVFKNVTGWNTALGENFLTYLN